MGRPRAENPSSSKERMKKLRANTEKRMAENERRAAARAKRNNETPLSSEELEEKRRNARERQRKSRAKKATETSRQKIQGAKLKDRNRKRKSHGDENPVPTPTSAERTRHYRERLKVRVDGFCRLKPKRKACVVGKSIANILKSLSPKSKASALDLSLTPKTKKSVFDSHNLDEGTGMALFKTLSKNRDKLSNCTRRLVLGKMTLTNKVARNNWTSVQHAVNLSATKILIHYKEEKTKKTKPPTEVQKLVLEFYNRDDVSRVLPYKNLTRRVKDHNGNYQRVPVRVMEITLRKALSTFKNLHPEVKICRRSFESLRPKNIRLTRCAKRLQCGCTYHTNID